MFGGITMSKTISIEAGSVTVNPAGSFRVNVDLDVEYSDLLQLLDEMEYDDIISFLEDDGYTVTKK